MNGRLISVGEALELLVPPFDDDAGDWDEIIRRATGAGSSAEAVARKRPRRLRWTRRRVQIACVAVALVGALIATPAFGIRGLILDLFDRSNVPFTGKTAPLEVKRDFFDLSLGLPSSIAPQAIASQARRVATFRVGGKMHVLWVAPTRDGGYCYRFSRAFGGCRAKRDRTGPTPAHALPGYVHPALVGVTFQAPTRSKVHYVSQIGGDLIAPNAYSLTVKYASGRQMRVRFYYVTRPINAGFFFAGIPAGHDTTATRATAVELRNKAGHLIARQPFIFYETPASLAKLRAKQRAALKELLRRHPQRPPIRRSPPLPAPIAPLQRGEADGVSVVVGRNGIAVFDTSGATPRVRALIAGRQVGYNCFRRVPYHSVPVDLGAYRTTFTRVAIRIKGVGVRPPFMGCDIQGAYGHKWPDRLHAHSAVEIAFTPAGRRFLEDRAAARDLGLFVRSKAMHRIRKLSGGALDQAIQGRYRTGITKLNSLNAALPVDRIGYAISGDTTTFLERSTTGRRFYVRLVNGRIRNQNVKPLAFVF